MRSSLGFALSLGILATGLELWVRDPGHGALGALDGAVLVVVGVLLTTGLALAGALVEQGLKRIGLPVPSQGLVLGLPVAAHGATWVRFEWLRTWSATEPGLLAALAVAIGVVVLCSMLLARWLSDHRPVWVGIGLLGLAGAGWQARLPSLGAPPAGGTPVLLVTLDTVRMDRLGVYGGPVATPFLDMLAQEGVVFDQAIAPAPLTQSSHLAMLTGVPPHESGVVSNGTHIGNRPDMVQHAFAKAGFDTAAFVSGFPLHSRFGWAQGFRRFDDDFGRIPGLERLGLARAVSSLLGSTPIPQRAGDATVSRFRKHVQRRGGRPWFAWVHLFDAHAPYGAVDLESADTSGPPLSLPDYWPASHKAITDTGVFAEAYDAGLAHVDSLLGEILEAVGEDVVVVLVGDHGESLTEHGTLFDHGDHLYDVSLRVPLLVRAPTARAGHRVTCQFPLVDLAALLRELGGLDDGPASGWMEALGGGDCADRPALSTTVGARYQRDPPIDHALRMPGEKVIRGEEGWVERYDLAVDPGETVDLATADPAATRAAVERLKAGLAGEVIPLVPERDPDTKAALGALGYVESD
jgi:arylsulfatase A-like enzyme